MLIRKIIILCHKTLKHTLISYDSAKCWIALGIKVITLLMKSGYFVRRMFFQVSTFRIQFWIALITIQSVNCKLKIKKHTVEKCWDIKIRFLTKEGEKANINWDSMGYQTCWTLNNLVDRVYQTDCMAFPI